MINLFVIEGNPSGWEEAIRMTAETLKEKGCVGDDFYDKCIEREKVYPTGLPTYMPVAIPHAEGAVIHKTAICIMRLEKPVSFHNMENIETEINVNYVLNLAIMTGEGQLKALATIIHVFQDVDFVNSLENTTLEELQQAFYNKWAELQTDDSEE